MKAAGGTPQMKQHAANVSQDPPMPMHRAKRYPMDPAPSMTSGTVIDIVMTQARPFANRGAMAVNPIESAIMIGNHMS